jgi:hypothetical protein
MFYSGITMRPAPPVSFIFSTSPLHISITQKHFLFLPNESSTTTRLVASRSCIVSKGHTPHTAEGPSALSMRCYAQLLVVPMRCTVLDRIKLLIRRSPLRAYTTTATPPTRASLHTSHRHYFLLVGLRVTRPGGWESDLDPVATQNQSTEQLVSRMFKVGLCGDPGDPSKWVTRTPRDDHRKRRFPRSYIEMHM